MTRATAPEGRSTEQRPCQSAVRCSLGGVEILGPGPSDCNSRRHISWIFVVRGGPSGAQRPDQHFRARGTVGSPPMGSSGMKKKGRTHQPKVGSPKEQQYARHQQQQAVVGNFGVTSKGWLFWGSIIILVMVAVGLLSWIFLF